MYKTSNFDERDMHQKWEIKIRKIVMTLVENSCIGLDMLFRSFGGQHVKRQGHAWIGL